MSRKYKFWYSNKMYFISFATVHWIDVFTRNEYKDEMIKCWQFWQQHNQPIEILNQKMYAEIVYYIHQNPAVSGFVHEAEQWVYSSAKNYAKNDGIIKLAEC